MCTVPLGTQQLSHKPDSNKLQEVHGGQLQAQGATGRAAQQIRIARNATDTRWTPRYQTDCTWAWVAHLGAELSGGGYDDNAGRIAHGEAVAQALLLLAQRLHQWQKVRQRFAAPCTQHPPRIPCCSYGDRGPATFTLLLR